MCIISISNFLCISENVVAKQYTHMTLDSCERNLVETSKERKFRYCGPYMALSLRFLSSLTFETVVECIAPALL